MIVASSSTRSVRIRIVSTMSLDAARSAKTMTKPIAMMMGVTEMIRNVPDAV